MTKSVLLDGATKHLENVLDAGDGVLEAGTAGDCAIGVWFVSLSTSVAGQFILRLDRRSTAVQDQGLTLVLDSPANGDLLIGNIVDLKTPNTTLSLASNIAIAGDNLRHFAMLVRRGGGGFLYLDAVKQTATGASVHDLTATSKANIGFQVGAKFQNSVASSWFDGYIAPPFYIDGTVTDAQVTTIYNAGVPVLSSTLPGGKIGYDMDDVNPIPNILESIFGNFVQRLIAVNMVTGDVVDFPFDPITNPDLVQFDTQIQQINAVDAQIQRTKLIDGQIDLTKLNDGQINRTDKIDGQIERTKKFDVER